MYRTSFRGRYAALVATPLCKAVSRFAKKLYGAWANLYFGLTKFRRRIDYWRSALRFYGRAAFWQSGVAWAPALVAPPVFWALHGFREPLRGVLITMALGLCLGAVLSLGIFGTVLAYDFKRNWGASDPTVE